jgi:hypothetical protein
MTFTDTATGLSFGHDSGRTGVAGRAMNALPFRPQGGGLKTGGQSKARKERKRFFFEKKNQKTFPGAARCVAAAQANELDPRNKRAKRPGKVFWFFFPKKNRFASLPFA